MPLAAFKLPTSYPALQAHSPNSKLADRCPNLEVAELEAVGIGYPEGVTDPGSEHGQRYEARQLPKLDLELGIDVLKGSCDISTS